MASIEFYLIEGFIRCTVLAVEKATWRFRSNVDGLVRLLAQVPRVPEYESCPFRLFAQWDTIEQRHLSTQFIHRKGLLSIHLKHMASSCSMGKSLRSSNFILRKKPINSKGHSHGIRSHGRFRFQCMFIGTSSLIFSSSEGKTTPRYTERPVPHSEYLPSPPFSSSSSTSSSSTATVAQLLDSAISPPPPRISMSTGKNWSQLSSYVGTVSSF